jgi:acetylornithine/succinyldiaminopimelate/putrescine aminotransferase
VFAKRHRGGGNRDQTRDPRDGSRAFVALEGAFHGQTLGALQLTADPSSATSSSLGLRVIRVAVNDIDQLEQAFADAPPLAGFIFEPVQGEGGVRPVTPAFARRAANLRRADTPLIADECQTVSAEPGRFSRANSWASNRTTLSFPSHSVVGSRRSRPCSFAGNGMPTIST